MLKDDGFVQGKITHNRYLYSPQTEMLSTPLIQIEIL